MKRPAFCIPIVIAVIGSVATAQTIPVWPGVAPGSEHWTRKETTYPNTPLGAVVINVVTPTLTAYLPPAGKRTGAGVIIAPGGGFVALAVDVEARDLATWLQQRGIAAFVLKYRTVEKLQPGIPQMDMDTAGRYGIADGIQALRVVRRHAAEWGLSAERIGIIGFSAGAMVASGALLTPAAADRPGFAAMIYGGPFGVMPKVPAGLPPTFLAWASDDRIAAGAEARLRDSLRAAGNLPEVHIYSSGGHGFGTRKQGTDSDRWMEDFGRWLDSITVARAVGAAPHPAPPRPLESLATARVGRWHLDVRFEPTGSGGKVVEGPGDESWSLGPGAITLVEQEQIPSPFGEMFLTGVIWWDGSRNRLGGMECNNNLPTTCDLRGALDDVAFAWDGRKFQIDEVEIHNGRRTIWHEYWSDITPDSFTQTGDVTQPDGTTTRFMIIHGTRLK
jgi:acetyl esterase/lipase